MLQEGLTSESVFQRDWRESRVSLESPKSPRGEQEDEVGPLPTFPSHSQNATDRRSSSRKPSPASSIRSRSSAQGLQPSAAGGSSLRQSPFLNRYSGSTAGDPIDVDNLDLPSTTTQSTSVKRKAMASAQDDDVEIVEGPVASKRSKGKSAARPKAAKRK